MASVVRIDWNRKYNNEAMWNQVSAWAVEHFGLPGDRFACRANVNYMDFVFPSNKDALIMALYWNARIVPEEELTVELVGSKLQ